MTFYADLLCESAALVAAEPAVPELVTLVAEGFVLDPSNFEERSAIPALDGGIDQNPLDGDREARLVFGDLSTIETGSGWGLNARTGVEFGDAFRHFCDRFGVIRPGTLVGYWQWLTGPEGTTDSPRFTRREFDSVDALLQHEGPHNQVVLVRV